MLIPKRFVFLVMTFAFLCNNAFGQKQITLDSPLGNLHTVIRLSDGIYYSVSLNGKVLMKDNKLQMMLKDANIGENPRLMAQKKTVVKDSIHPLIPLKYASVRNQYNSLVLRFKGDYAVEFRAFDDGLAYRFLLNRGGILEVLDEQVKLNFTDDYLLHLQQVWRSFDTPYEEPYTHLAGSKFNSDSKMSTLPILIEHNSNCKILFSEADLRDYPVMLIRGGNGSYVNGAFPENVKTQEFDGRDQIRIKERENYIAKTSGNRSFPWRFFVITEDDNKILENTMVARLASPSKIKDPSWIQAGQTVWDWWNYAMPYNVDFKAGRNQATYKYFIDFAAANGIPYTLIDDGWANSRKEPFKTNPDVNMDSVMSYAKEKNIKVILWMHWTAVENNFDKMFEIYKKWGVSGLKIDFMERNDQWMVNFYERVAKKAAENKMIILFHGSFKPAGLEYIYPNILSYEAVRGLEWKGEATADNSIYIPFMRNAVGPMDFTPGAMVSMQPEYYANADFNPAAIGTRAMQLAHFVIFESGMQMLADNPTRYNKEKECFDFIKSVPVTWDETRALKSRIGEYVLIAKRKGKKWFLGAITNNRLAQREIIFEAGFLSPGTKYTMTSFEDGPNANQVAMDYRKRTSTVLKDQKIKINLAKSGGWAAFIE